MQRSWFWKKKVLWTSVLKTKVHICSLSHFSLQNNDSRKQLKFIWTINYQVNNCYLFFMLVALIIVGKNNDDDDYFNFCFRLLLSVFWLIAFATVYIYVVELFYMRPVCLTQIQQWLVSCQFVFCLGAINCSLTSGWTKVPPCSISFNNFLT